ncbi:MAG: hypothetical protein GF405_04860 [Candidatus Eisenbacteria bacterium]|nr:hypothetical protein [Candidatus Eisenbacteria bacterium]
MRASPNIALVFGDDVAPVVRRRLTYAFRVFCAVKGARAVDDRSGQSDVVRLCYGAPCRRQGDVRLEPAYTARPAAEPPGSPRTVAVNAPDGEAVAMPVFHSDGAPPECVDWLGEIFEWLSGTCERTATERDAVGRVPMSGAPSRRFGLSPSIPYASVAVTELDRRIARSAGGLWTAGLVSPWDDTPLGVAVTHDIDFLPDHPGASLSRWARNTAVGAFRMRSLETAFRAGTSIARPFLGRTWLHNALRRFREREQKREVRSTWTVVCRAEHGRDPTYRLESDATRAALDGLASSGAEIGVHGSYTSLDGPGRLADEYDRLRVFGFRPVGGRQHWLRYDGDGLFRELERAGALYDATAGFHEDVGFRHGAAFPFPPYDLERERAFQLLELPLVVMDVALAVSTPPDQRLDRCRAVLREASRWTWGGVSVLWHDTSLTNALHPESLGELYFELLDGPGCFCTGKELAETVRERYAVAGLKIGSAGGSS